MSKKLIKILVLILFPIFYQSTLYALQTFTPAQARAEADASYADFLKNSQLGNLPPAEKEKYSDMISKFKAVYENARMYTILAGDPNATELDWNGIYDASRQYIELFQEAKANGFDQVAKADLGSLSSTTNQAADLAQQALKKMPIDTLVTNLNELANTPPETQDFFINPKDVKTKSDTA